MSTARTTAPALGPRSVDRVAPAATPVENRALNAVRTVAALLVVTGHVRLLFFRDYSEVHHSSALALAYSVTSLGSEAVIVFFVLSGYWVGGSVMRQVAGGRFRWGSYSAARLTRLWLVLVPALALTYVVDTVGRLLRPGADIYAHTIGYSGVPTHPLYSIDTLLGNLFFLQQLHVQVYGLNHPLWSLAYEFWFYLIFPASLMTARSQRRPRMLVVNVGLAVVGLLIGGTPVLSLFPAWLAGALAAYVAHRGAPALRACSSRRLGVARAAFLVFTIAAMVGVRQSNGPLWHGAPLIAVPTAVLLGLLSRDLDWRGASGKVLGVVSSQARYSYSLYAIHMPLVALACSLIGPRLTGRWPLDPIHSLCGAIVIAAVMVIAAAFANVTEKRTPLIRALLSRVPRRSVAGNL